MTVVYLLVKLTSLMCFMCFFLFKGSAVGLTVLLNTCLYVLFILFVPLVLPVFSNK